MATLFGAWALRAETTTGSIKPGKSADLAIVSLLEPRRSRPLRPAARIRLSRDQHGLRGGFRERTVGRRMIRQRDWAGLR